MSHRDIQLEELRVTGELAQQVADLAVRCVGPNGTMVRVTGDDVSMVRAMLIGQLAETAIKIANGEPLQ